MNCFMQVQSLDLSLHQDTASGTAVASLEVTSTCIELEKLSEKLQADLTVRDFSVYDLTGPLGKQRELLLSQMSGRHHPAFKDTVEKIHRVVFQLSGFNYVSLSKAEIIKASIGYGKQIYNLREYRVCRSKACSSAFVL